MGVCVAVCIRGVPIRVIRRLVVGYALGWTNDCNQQELRAGGARQACLLAPPFPLRKHKWAPIRATSPPCLLPSKPLPPTTFSSVRDSASLNLANTRPGIILPSLLPRESRRHINRTRNPLESKHARRGELSCALARPKLSSIEPLFPHVERASVKLCRNTAQRSDHRRTAPVTTLPHLAQSGIHALGDDTVQRRLVSLLTAGFWSLRLAAPCLDMPLSAHVHIQDVLARSRAPSRRTHTREYARDLS